MDSRVDLSGHSGPRMVHVHGNVAQYVLISALEPVFGRSREFPNRVNGKDSRICTIKGAAGDKTLLL